MYQQNAKDQNPNVKSEENKKDDKKVEEGEVVN